MRRRQFAIALLSPAPVAVVAVRPDGHATVARARYGEPTPVAAGCGNTMK